MHRNIHRELTYKVIQRYPNEKLLEFLLESMVRPYWKEELRTRANRIEWLKQWMDTPDDSKHGSTMRNDHSYKLRKVGNRLKLDLGGGSGELATVAARLKYDARDIKEWKVEEEPRICGLEIAICMHWVVDISSPPHTYADCDQKFHDKIEDHFDTFWKGIWPGIEGKIEFPEKSSISDVYGWARSIAMNSYDRNEKLISAYKEGKTMKKDAECAFLGSDVIREMAKNIADFLAYVNARIDITKTYEMLMEQNALWQ